MDDTQAILEDIHALAADHVAAGVYALGEIAVENYFRATWALIGRLAERVQALEAAAKEREDDGR